VIVRIETFEGGEVQYLGLYNNLYIILPPPDLKPIAPISYSHLALFCHLCLKFPCGVLYSGFQTKTLYAFLIPPMNITCPIDLTHLRLVTLMYRL